MSLSSLLTMSIDIYRSQKSVGVQTKYGLLYEGVPTMIQPIVGEFYSKTEMTFDKTYNAYFPIGTDIITSDKCIDNNGVTYQVTGILNRPYGNAVQHMTVILSEEVDASFVQED